MSTLTRNEARTDSGAAISENRNYLSPKVNISETKEGYTLEAEMPGVSKGGLEITLEGSELAIVGRRHVGVENAALVYRESSPRDFRRMFELDPAIDAARITAKMDQGILTMHLPRAERVKPRKIAVND